MTTSPTFRNLPNLKDLKSIFEGPQYARWQSFRESEDARYVGLALPRFLLRLPYGEATKPVKSFNYEESVSDSHDRYCWGNAAFSFATRLTESAGTFTWARAAGGDDQASAALGRPGLSAMRETFLAR